MAVYRITDLETKQTNNHGTQRKHAAKKRGRRNGDMAEHAGLQYGYGYGTGMGTGLDDFVGAHEAENGEICRRQERCPGGEVAVLERSRIE